MQRHTVSGFWDRDNLNGTNRNFQYLFEGQQRIIDLNNKANTVLEKAEKVNDNISFSAPVFNDNFIDINMIELFDEDNLILNKAIDNLTDIYVDNDEYSISNYMPIPSDSSLIYTINGESVFGMDESGARKIAVWDSKNNFIETVRIRDLTEFKKDYNCFIRVVFFNRDENISIKTEKTKMISSHVTADENNPSLSAYQTDELIELYDSTKTTSQAYLYLSGTLTENTSYVLSDYIYTPPHSILKILIDDNDWWVRDDFLNENGNKLIVFDADKNWKETTPFNQLSQNDFTFKQAKFIKVQALKSTLSKISVKNDRLAKLSRKNISGMSETEYDLFVFAGQSNMAGRGDSSEAPDSSDIAYEYRAVTEPDILSPLTEPFGGEENKSGGIDDGNRKTGSLVSSFAKKYYEIMNMKMIGISASEGGTEISEWQPGTPLLNDLKERVADFNDLAVDNNLKIRNRYLVWNQGESDNTKEEEYYNAALNNILNELKSVGINKILLIRVGYENVAKVQTDITRKNEGVILIGNKFPSLKDEGHTSDGTHFTQNAYNIQGEQAGKNAAYFIQNLKEPVMYDDFFDELYFSHTD